MERLDKLLASTGRWSRKEARALVRGGRVRVDGRLPAGPEEKIPDTADVAVDGRPVPIGRSLYIMLHKPAGVISSTGDPREKTVMELLPGYLRRTGLAPVGRLDKETEGLLLLTNDGGLAHRLLSPGKHVDKVYYAEVDGILDEGDRAAFEAGILLGDGTRCLPAVLEPLDGPSCGLVTLREGKYHQVRRMLASRGKPVTYLKRLSMGPLELDPALPPGAWRFLTGPECTALGVPAPPD